MPSKARHRITLERQDGSTLELGDVHMEMTRYGEKDESHAITQAKGELVDAGDFYQFRGTLIPKADLRSLRADLVQIENLEAAVTPKGGGSAAASTTTTKGP